MKLRKILRILIALVISFGGISITTFASENKQLTVNDGTDTNEYLPAYRGILNCPQQTEFIQPADTLTSMKGGKISKMTFYVSEGGTSDASFTVKLLETDESTFDGVLINTVNAGVVYAGTINPVDNKIEITFSNPYEYKGKNLLIAFTLEVFPDETSSTTFYGTNVTSNVGLTTYGLDMVQNIAFLPKVTFEYTPPTYLDLDTNTSKEIDQNYTFTKVSEKYTDVTKVKLEWTMSDILVNYKSNKTWDPSELAWVETKENIAASNTNASFTLTNYSSKDLVANVEFEVEESLKGTFTKATFTNNDCTIKTPVTKDNNSYLDTNFNALKQTIEANLTLNTDNFKDLNATTSKAKYGTYTISISAAPSVKQSQTCPTPEILERGMDKITLNPVVSGHGATKYGINTIDTPPETWQDSTEFTDLTSGTTYYFFAKYEGDDDYEPAISASISDTACLPAGTKITMADGTLKNIEEISEGDSVLTFNHELGIYEAQKVYLVWSSEYKAKAFTLHFDNGKTISIVGEHDLFEKESLKYVTIDKSNVEEFIGKHFYSVDEGKYVKLISVSLEDEEVDFYSLYVGYNANCIANGMLTVTVEAEDSLNIYEIYEDLTIDHIQLEKDIEKYGLYEYSLDAPYSKEYYDELQIRYVNIMVGKGLVTWKELEERINSGIENE